MERTRTGMFRWRTLTLLSLALLAGCDATSQPNGKSSTAAATSTTTLAQPNPIPTLLAITVKQLALNGYDVEGASATTTGFVFTATGNDAQGQQASLLYYHDLTTGVTTLADSAAWDPHRCTGGCSGAVDTIWVEAVTGNLAVYIHTGIGGAAGSLRVLDVGRWRQFTLDTSTAYATGGESLPVVAATDGQRVAWLPFTFDASGFGASAIHVFDTSVGAESASFPTDAGYYYSLGFAGGNLVYSQSPGNGARGDQIPIFSQPLADGAAAVQLATGPAPVLPSGDDAYVAWDQINGSGGGTTTVLSLQATSQALETYPCTRPQLAGHYMACIVFGRNLDLWDLTTGDSASFGATGSSNDVSISSGQVVWWDGKMVNYVALPQ